MNELAIFGLVGLVVGALVVGVMAIGKRSKYDAPRSRSPHSDANSGAHFGYGSENDGGGGGD